LFAAIAALIALGFSREPRLRKVLEVGIGCTLGILIGDMVLHVLGRNLLTASLVLFVAIMLARFLDRSPLLAMQMGLQSLLVVLIPAPESGVFGPFSRSMDAVVGGVVAMLIALLTPRDPRREPIRELGRLVEELTGCLRELATGIRTSESRDAWHALIRSRAMQQQLDEASDAVASAKELTLYSPAYRRHRHYVRRMDRVADQLDLAVRSLRVVARRAVGVIDHAALSDEGSQGLAAVLDDLGDASALMAEAVQDPGRGYRRRTAAAQERLAAIAEDLHPERLSISTLEGEAMVMLLRPMVVDLLVAVGMPHEEAVEHLPHL
ncbi:MAG: FUSC family protein, partial [Nesterenkonia sp.]|nr:FUSC family protein [Nesterenkonia sp.]